MECWQVSIIPAWIIAPKVHGYTIHIIISKTLFRITNSSKIVIVCSAHLWTETAPFIVINFTHFFIGVVTSTLLRRGTK